MIDIKVPGFRCGSCPAGYTGDAPEGIGQPAKSQVCTGKYLNPEYIEEKSF